MKHRYLSSGATAPAFETRDWQGNPINLVDAHPGSTLLSFFRYASCPLCNLRIHELIKDYQTFIDHGIRILAVFQSPAERIAHYVERQAPPFPLIPDPGLKLYHLYRVEPSWWGFARAWTAGLPRVFRAVITKGFIPGTVENEIHRIPADFLIGPDRKLNDVYYGRDIGDHIPLERIFAHSG
jgi:peroxiredoxin